MDFASRLAHQITEDNVLHFTSFGLPEHNLLHPASASDIFAVTVEGVRLTTKDLQLEHIVYPSASRHPPQIDAALHGHGIEVRQHSRLYEDCQVFELWQTLENTASTPQSITRVDSFSLDISPGEHSVDYFVSDWGAEFQGVLQPLNGPLMLETHSGRSSKGMHPWFALHHANGTVLSGAVAWSGNWVFRFEPLEAGGYRISGGLHDWEFSKTLQPGERMTTPPIVLALGRDLNDVSQQFAYAGRTYWYPQNALSRQLPSEWNQWWAYEDIDINDDVFMANVNAAADMGLELCTLDAGWFGPSDAGTEWHKLRGDWHLVNSERFPRGLRALSDDVHRRGMKFGLWCEIEGLGSDAALAHEQPELVALRDGERLGYVCLGSPAAREWAFETLSRLIRENNVDWVKLDFNVDPGEGCNRTDHGHGPGDGLYEHYVGYYALLERIRAAFPDVLLESCSSGGLRIDLGLLRQTHLTFLSDPDWPVHDLQIFWGATTLLAPNACLHWTFSEWRGEGRPPQQNFDPHSSALTQAQLDYYTRIGMLGALGMSQKLLSLPDWVRQRLADHIGVYKQHVRRFVCEANLYRLTPQPRRDGSGDRWTAFQYSLPDASEHLLFVFRLPGAEPERAIRLANLEPERLYRITGYDGEEARELSGQQLMDEGIHFTTLAEEGSALLHLA